MDHSGRNFVEAPPVTKQSRFKRRIPRIAYLLPKSPKLVIAYARCNCDTHNAFDKLVPARNNGSALSLMQRILRLPRNGAVKLVRPTPGFHQTITSTMMTTIAIIMAHNNHNILWQKTPSPIYSTTCTMPSGITRER